MMTNKNGSRNGQAFLSLMLLIGGILAATGVALALIVISAINSSYGFQASIAAQTAAAAGAQDALLEIDRVNGLASDVTTAYSIGGVTPTVTVTQNSPASGEVTILSTATVSRQTRKIQVILSQNQTTGQTSLVSWQNVL